jgi:hypothetical protein
MYRASMVACVVAAIGLLGRAGYSALRPSVSTSEAAQSNGGSENGLEPYDRGLTVENAEQQLGERHVGEYEVVFRIANRSDQPGEVVGFPGSCGAVCCFSVKGPDRRMIPPGETSVIVGNLDVRRPGPFTFDGKLYLNDGGRLRTVRLKITGVGVAPEKPHAPPP